MDDYVVDSSNTDTDGNNNGPPSGNKKTDPIVFLSLEDFPLADSDLSDPNGNDEGGRWGGEDDGYDGKEVVDIISGVGGEDDMAYGEFPDPTPPPTHPPPTLSPGDNNGDDDGWLMPAAWNGEQRRRTMVGRSTNLLL